MKRNSFWSGTGLTFLVVLFSGVLLIRFVLSQNDIQRKTLPDDVEHWSREKANDGTPWFFQQVKNIFEVVFPNKDEIPFGKSVAFLVGVSEYEHLSPDLP